MCVANLNVTTQPCSHRWYQLVRPCSSTSNLANCPQRLKLEGWETKNQDCPWCSPPSSPVTDVDRSTHKLFGGAPTTTSYRRGSLSSAASSLTPSRGRTNSASSTASPPNSRSSSQDSDDEARELDRAERNRMMNRRLAAYIARTPVKAFNDRSDRDLPRVDESPFDTVTVARRDSMIGKHWKRGVRMSKGIFKG